LLHKSKAGGVVSVCKKVWWVK